jgi:lipid-A-disaccharide synthase
MTRKTIFISTGEVSGDLQGALLIEALKKSAKTQGIELEIIALGGDKMQAAGAKLLSNTTGIGSVGLLESLPFVIPTLQVQSRAKKYLQENPPDLVVLIDYMGPNISIGTSLRRHLPEVPIVFYIAPQEWVWTAGPMVPRKTAQAVVEITDQLLAIFPEEARYFEKKGASVTWVGHPLVDRMQSCPSREEARLRLGISPQQKVIALLPASRRQELKYMMPIVFEAAKQIQSKLEGTGDSQTPLFWIPLSLEAYRPAIEAAIQEYGLNATIVAGKTNEVLAAADLAIAKSGTVNLELALLNIPQVVLYKVSDFTYKIGRLLQFSISFMSPPNLVVMREIVPELLQEKATSENIVKEALDLLLNTERRQQLLKDYQEMRQLLGEVGVCDRAAQEILQLIK